MCAEMNMALFQPTPGAVLRGVLRHQASMAEHVSWRAGGAAEQVYVPADLADMANYVSGLPAAMPVYCVGLGSNLLVRDGGVHAAVVLLHGVLRELRLDSRAESSGLIYAEAGVAAPKLARFAAGQDLVGAEFMAGIPGTIGGALAMNAGCYGSETWRIAVRVLTMNRQGHLRQRERGDYALGYRHVALHDETEEWFIAGWFELAAGDGAASRRVIKDLLQRRIDSQPLGQPNAGSVFRNPPGDHAARLIESCGLKGRQLGGAQVSTKHANFIVNTGGATAADIEDLIDLVASTVLERCCVELQREVRVIGDRAREGA